MSKRLYWVAGIAGAAMACSAIAQVDVGNRSGTKINERTGRAMRVRPLAAGPTLTPVRVARAQRINGQIVAGEWINVAGEFEGRGPCATTGSLHDNCLTDVDGNPVGASICNIGDGARWWFGPAYNNPHYANDMTVVEGGEGGSSTRITYYASWNPPAAESCIFGIFVLEDFSQDCSVAPLGDAGILLDYGPVDPSSAFYYHFEAELCDTDLSWTMPADGEGGYEVLHLTDDLSNPGELIGATGPTQPMLFGQRLLDATEIPDMAGDQTHIQYDDDAPLDGAFDFAAECYSYAFGVCPDPLGAAMKFWGCPVPGPDCGAPVCRPDFDGDGFLTGLDFDAFVIAFEAGDPSSDYDGNGFVNGDDFDAYVIDFEAGC